MKIIAPIARVFGVFALGLFAAVMASALDQPLRNVQAATVVVNSASDSDDGNCDPGHCSLREAINATNAGLGEDVIVFDIPQSDPGFATSSSVWIIQPIFPLPTVTDTLVIDGYTQSGAFANTNPVSAGIDAVLKIRLDGALAGSSTNGILAQNAAASVSGLSITGFGGSGIQIEGAAFGASTTVISGNFIGVQPDGLTAATNGAGITISESPGNIIGGSTPASRNLVSGNGDGIVITGGISAANTVAGNFVGVDATGAAPLGNIFNGIGVFHAASNIIGGSSPESRNVISANRTGIQILGNAAASNNIFGNLIGLNAAGIAEVGNVEAGVMIFNAPDNRIGGSGSGEGNVISGNQAEGVTLFNSGSTGNRIQGNLIGTFGNQGQAIANGAQGVAIWGAAADNLIGGSAPGEGNVIAHNLQGGIRIREGTGNSILGNAMFANLELGIDLDFDGLTLNDHLDADSGANDLQNFPDITSAVPHLAGTVVKGTLYSAANTAYGVEYFANAACDPLLHGEGLRMVGAINVTTNSSGVASVNTTLGERLTPGDLITATATGPGGSTSEFSECRVILPPPVAIVAGGGIALEGISGEPAFSSATATVTFFDEDTGASRTVSVDGTGVFWATDVSEGTYTFRMDASGFLRTERTGVDVSGGTIRLPGVELTVGDVTGDTAIDVTDAAVLEPSFGAAVIGSRSTDGDLIDLNGDGFVNIHDLTLLASNSRDDSAGDWDGALVPSDDRYGVVLHRGLSADEQDWALGSLGADWFFDGTYSTDYPSVAQKVLWVGSLDNVDGDEEGPNAAALTAVAQRNRGATWIIANEPNRRTPEYDVANVLAKLHDAYEAIKTADPTAIIVSPPLLNFTFTCTGCSGSFNRGIDWAETFRLDYFTAYGEEPPVDIWAINAYPLDLNALPALDTGRVISQITGLREWLNARPAQAGKPIWVTEFGVQWAYDQRDMTGGGCVPKPAGTYDTAGVQGFLTTMYDWLDANADALNIERWFQYVAYQDITICNGDSYGGVILLDGPGTDATLTEAGLLFRLSAAGLR